MSSNLIIVMGVSGCGKSTIAEALAKKFSYQFIEADNFHSVESKALMASGKPLNDRDREPWIKALQLALKKYQQSNTCCVMSFSGLRSAHRNAMRGIFNNSLFLHLKAPREIIAHRINARHSHFMPVTLLDSQYEALQATTEEADVITINAHTTVNRIIENCTTEISKNFNMNVMLSL